MENEADRTIKTVKGISGAAWDRGLIAAKKRGEPFGVWLARAIDRQVDLEAGDRVILPDEREVGLPAEGDQSALDSLDVLATLYAGLGQIAGQKGCGGLAQRTRALIEQRIAALALEPLPAKRGAPRRITDGNA